jgi:CHAT domain-containing protein
MACIGFAVVAAALAWPIRADEPKPLTTDLVSAPSKFTIQQQRRVRERDRYEQEVKKLRGAGKFDDALGLAKKMLAIDQEVFGNEHPLVPLSMSLGAEIEADRGNFPNARRITQDVLARQRKLHGDKHWRVSDAERALRKVDRLAGLSAKERDDLVKAARLLGQCEDLYQRRQHAQAVPLAKEAVDLYKRVLGEKDPDYLQTLYRYALYRHYAGEPDEPAELFRREAVEITKDPIEKKLPEYAVRLYQLATLYPFEFTKQAPLADQAAAIFLEALEPTDADFANHLYGAGTMLFKNRKRAEQALLKAVQIFKATGRDLTPTHATCLSVLGQVYTNISGTRPSYTQAETVLTQEVKVRKENATEDPRGYADSLRMLAGVYHGKGTPELAAPLLKEMEGLNKRIPKVDLDSVADMRQWGRISTERGKLIQGYLQRRDYAGAEALYKKWLANDEKAFGYKPAEDLAGLARVYEGMGESEKAITLYLENAEISKRRSGEKSRLYINALVQLETITRRLGKRDEADALAVRILALEKETEGEKSAAYARALVGEAGRHAAKGEHEKAEAIYRQSFGILSEMGSVIDPRLVPGIQVQSVLYARAGAFGPAQRLLQMYLDYSSQYVENVFSVQSERQRLATLRLLRNILDMYIQVALVSHKQVPAAEFYRQVLAWKNIAVPHPEERLTETQPDIKDLVNRLSQARTQFAELAFRIPPPERRQEWIDKLSILRNEKENLESELSRKSATYRRYKESRQLGAAEVAQALPAGTVLVDFFQYNERAGFAPGGPATGKLLAFVLRADRDVAGVAILDWNGGIDRAVSNWRQAIVQGDIRQLEAASRLLCDRIWQPLQPHLSGAKTVLIAPDASLSQIPFAALPGAQPGSFLIEDVAIGYVTSGRQVVELLGNPEPGSRGLLAIGGISYDAETADSTLPAGIVKGPAVSPKKTTIVSATPPLVGARDRAGFNFLAGTDLEARRCREIYTQVFPKERSLFLHGSEPTKKRVEDEFSRRYQYVHLATHGFFESPDRIASFRAFSGAEPSPPEQLAPTGSDGGQSTASQVQGRPSGKSSPTTQLRNSPARGGYSSVQPQSSDLFAVAPLLHSGLALAGASRQPKHFTEGQEEGILTAEEVEGLDLRSTELVVLSACDTGLGNIEQGQGVLGLQRAFHAAGARTLIASLWKLEDAATSIIVEEFYTNFWKKKMSKLEALRQAQLTVLANPDRVQKRREELKNLEELRGTKQNQKIAEAGAPATGKASLASTTGAKPAPLAAKQAGPASQLATETTAVARTSPLFWAALVLSGDFR